MQRDTDGWNDPYDSGGGGAAAPAGDPWTPDELAQSQQWANQYYSSHQIPAGYGTPDDIANSYVQQRRAGMSHADAMSYLQTVPGRLGWDKYGQQPTPTPTPGPTPGPGPGQPPAGSIGAMDPAAVFTPPAAATFTGTPPPAPPPGFAPPSYAKPAAFQEPDYASALTDPGYQFEASEGTRRMEQSAAARGVLNGGGTLKDINAWGQNFASQRVNDVRDRAVNNYLLNYQTQYTDPYKYAYQTALDTFTGGLNLWQGQNSQWQTQQQTGQRAAEDAWQQAYTPFNDMWNRRITVGLS